MNDKIKHFIAGAIISLVASLLIGLLWMRDLMILGAVCAALAGLAKEIIWDNWLDKGTPEFADFWFTLWGGLTTSILLYFIL